MRKFILAAALAFAELALHSPVVAAQTHDVTAPTNSYAQYQLPVLANATLFDARGEQFELYWSKNTDPLGLCSVGPLPVNVYPIRNSGVANGIAYGTQDARWLGGLILGDISMQFDRRLYDTAPYCNSASWLSTSNVSVGQEIRQVRIDRAWDAIRISGDNCKLTVGLCDDVIDEVWLSNVRDDCIENDDFSGLVLTDSLLDGCFAGISATNSCASCPSPRPHDVIQVDGVLMRLQGFPYTYDADGPTGPGGLAMTMHHIGPFKIYPALGPSVVIHDSVIAFEYYDGTRYASWAEGWGRIASCSNNYLLWMPDTPFPLPEGTTAYPPSCFTILKGAAARVFWEQHKADWIAAHPTIQRAPGDPQ